MSFVNVAIGVGSAVVGGIATNRAADKASDATRDGNNASIAEQRAAREDFNQRIAPFEALRGDVQDPLLAGILGTGDLAKERNRLQQRLDNAQRLGYGVEQVNFLRERLGKVDSILQNTPQIPGQVDLASLPASPQALDPNALPAAPQAFNQNMLSAAPQALDVNALPASGEVFNANDLDNPILSFLRKEGFRGINENGAGGGRNVDRDLVEFNAGLMSTVAPQLQQQRFNQQEQIRQQAGQFQQQAFNQQGAVRSQEGQAQQQAFNQGNVLRQMAGQDQNQMFNQQTALRGNALAEQSGLRADALNENQTRINNLYNILGMSQNAAVGAGNAGMQTSNNISNALANIGAGNAQAAINKGNNISNTIGNLTSVAGMWQGMQNPTAPAPSSGSFNALDPNLFNFSSRGLGSY